MCCFLVAGRLEGDEDEEEGWESAENSAAVGASRVIFLERRVWRGRAGLVVVVVLKGGLRMPILGVMRNFWWAGGMDIWVSMAVERSVIVEEEEAGRESS